MPRRCSTVRDAPIRLAEGVSYTTLSSGELMRRSPPTPACARRGRTLNVRRRAATAEGRLTDGKGRLLAHASTTCLIFDLPTR
jgi:acyl-coenzyme A thioesterase PaaI-like protein